MCSCFEWAAVRNAFLLACGWFPGSMAMYDEPPETEKALIFFCDDVICSLEMISLYVLLSALGWLYSIPYQILRGEWE